jgi:hypothetical protein
VSSDVETTMAPGPFTLMRSALTMQRMLVNEMILGQDDFTPPNQWPTLATNTPELAHRPRRAALRDPQRRRAPPARRQDRLAHAEGAAGMGKTTLLARRRADARRRGWTVLSGRATVLEMSNDFGVLRQPLAGLGPLPDGRPATALLPAAEEDSPFTMFEQVSAHVLKAMAADPALITGGRPAAVRPAAPALARLCRTRSADRPVALVLVGSPGGR